jgi:hypothetical protein
MKTIWLTSLGSSQDAVNKFMHQMRTYGLEAKGHFWKDDLKKLAWMAPRDDLIDSKISLWVILGSEEELLNPKIRYGLSLLAITVQARRSPGFPIIILQTHGDPVSDDQLAMPLKGTDIFSASDPGIGAKLVAKAHKTSKQISPEYIIDVYGNEQIGQWFEVRPVNSTWPGAMFGVDSGEITFQAVGPYGNLPSKSVLNYPMEGLKLNLGNKEYTAWAAQNELNPETSYFVKVDGFPESILFGPYSTEEAADVYVIKLK